MFFRQTLCDLGIVVFSLVFFCLFFGCKTLASGGDKTATLGEKCVGTDGRLDINIVDLDTNIEKVCDRIRKLDKVLTDMYKDPPVDGGDEMMRLSRTYNQACLDLLYFCTLDKMKALKAAQDILDHEGPKFIDVEIKDRSLKDRFKWNETEIRGLYLIRKNTIEHWFDLNTLYKKLPY